MDGFVACSINREISQVTTHEEVFTDYSKTAVRFRPAPYDMRNELWLVPAINVVQNF